MRFLEKRYSTIVNYIHTNNTSDSYVVHLTLNERFTGIWNLWQEMIHHCKPLSHSCSSPTRRLLKCAGIWVSYLILFGCFVEILKVTYTGYQLDI